MKRPGRTRKQGQKCPECGELAVRPILYGMPTPSAFEAAERGEFIIGGCCIFPGQADKRCTACGWDDGTETDIFDGLDIP
jgi:hypothetical protein